MLYKNASVAMLNPADSQEDTRDLLRSALQKFPAAVTVIALRTADGGFLATTATAVTVLTLDPPTMLACLNRGTLIGQALEKVEAYSINVLRADQKSIAEACAGGVPHDHREFVGRWSDTASGVPVLEGAQASIVCGRSQFTAYGTHNLLFGTVESVVVGEALEPLLYLNRAYGAFASE